VILSTVLVVDDSILCTHLVSTLLEPHATRILTASSAAEAIECINKHPDLDLVVSDVIMRHDNGFEILEHVAMLTGPKPRVVLVTARPTAEDRTRAEDLGAQGYLSKPMTLREIFSSLDSEPREERRETYERARCSGTATLVAPESSMLGPLVWDVYNISDRGAFLETKGPLPVGDEVELELHLAGLKTRVRARIVRVQEPSWLDLAGVGVEFLNPGVESQTVIQAAIDRA
jgi:CheY-like chemotaxis protein